jgi:maltose O-acetyltransferase
VRNAIANPGRPALRTLQGTLEPVKRWALRRLRGELNVNRLVAEGLDLGRGVYIGRGVFIDAGHPWLISIGDDSVITSGTVVLAHDASPKLHTACTRIARVVIGDRVFVGAGAVILPGSRIGDDSIVGALTVVRGEVPPGSVVAGNPGTVVSDVASFAERHRNAAARGPVWPHEGWMAGRGITEARKRAQRDALAAGVSGYVRGGLVGAAQAESENGEYAARDSRDSSAASARPPVMPD